MMKGLSTPSSTNLQLSLWAPDQVRCEQMGDAPATWNCGSSVTVGVALIKTGATEWEVVPLHGNVATM